MSVLIWRESYLEKKNLKKSLQQLTSIFANYLKKKKKKIVTLFYGRFQRLRYTHRLWEDKDIYAF